MRNPLLTRVAVLTLVTLLLGCSGPSIRPGKTLFQHDVPGNIVPWTNKAFDSSDDKFTFAIFSDLTGGERERIF